MRHLSVPVKRGNGHAEMRIKTFVIVITAIMMMAVTPSFAQALGLHTAYTSNGTPYYTEAAMVIECKIMYAAPFEPQYFKSDAPQKMYANFPAGIHSMYIGEVVNAWKK